MIRMSRIVTLCLTSFHLNGNPKYNCNNNNENDIKWQRMKTKASNNNKATRNIFTHPSIANEIHITISVVQILHWNMRHINISPNQSGLSLFLSPITVHFDIYKVWRVQCPQYLWLRAVHCFCLSITICLFYFLFVRVSLPLFSLHSSFNSVVWQQPTLMQCRWNAYEPASQLNGRGFFFTAYRRRPSKNGQRWKYL